MAVQVPALALGSLHANLDAIVARHGEPPWVEPLVMTDDIQAFVICHPPGQPNDTHYHQHDEWWVVLKGEIDWWLEGRDEPIRAQAGDVCSARRTPGTTSSRPARNRRFGWGSRSRASSTATIGRAAARSRGG